jgi:hypothetical protein
MATRKSSNYFWKYSHLHKEDYLNSFLSQSAKEEFDKVDACTDRQSCSVGWTDLYVIFRNSRTLVMEANGLEPTDDGDLKAMAEVMRDNHNWLRKLLFLVAIENLFRLGSRNTWAFVYVYCEELELVRMIDQRLADTDETVQVHSLIQAHLLAAI